MNTRITKKGLQIIHLRVTGKQYADLTRKADAASVSISQLCRIAISDYLRKEA